jgi:spore germination cell wall hydrolase CwlJ-like protein
MQDNRGGMKRILLIAVAVITSGPQYTPIQQGQIYRQHRQQVARAARMESLQRADHTAQTAGG